MAYEHLQVEIDEAVALVTVNRPAVLNALNAASISELEQAMLQVRDDAAVRVVILTGAGTKAFVAGADIKEMSSLSPVEGYEYARTGQRLLDLIENLGKPVIAAVNGFALGGGNELAMACTVRVAADTARFGQPEIKLGLIPGYAGTQRLSRLVGQGRALHLLLTGEAIDAQEAWRIGLVNRVVPAADVLSEARTLATSLAAAAPVAVRYILDAVHHGREMPLADGTRFEATLFGLVFSTDDMREGTRAFIEKRKPEFKGR
jgi:enoyl-CoA hydratase